MTKEEEEKKRVEVPISTQVVGVRPGYLSEEVPLGSPSGTAAVQRPVETDYDWYSKNFAPLFEKPLDEEERRRRERAAVISSGVQHLGNAMGAIGNMLYASGGAPAQKLADTPDVDSKINAFRARADRVRQQYLNGIATARKGDKRDYSDAFNRYLGEIKAQNTKNRLAFERDREARLIRDTAVREQNAESMAELRAAQAQYNRERAETERLLRDGKITKQEAEARYRDAMSRLADTRAGVLGGGTTVTTENAFGTTKKTTTPNVAPPHSAGGGGTQSGNGLGWGKKRQNSQDEEETDW